MSESEKCRVGPFLLKLIDTTRWHMAHYVKQVTDAVKQHSGEDTFQMDFNFDYENEAPDLEYRLLGLSAHRAENGNIFVVAELLPIAETGEATDAGKSKPH
ncbi:MAG: hypothetical protein KAJ73_00195 [Zetaproteobacteria bacterium]|nr:hypothetical protein [Zetaproteobacteria bacterium]